MSRLNFVGFPDRAGEQATVSIDHIVCFEPSGTEEGKTIITLTTRDRLVVNAPYAVVQETIERVAKTT